MRAILLVLTACTPDKPTPDTSDSAEPSMDTRAATLRETTDLCAYEDGETVDVPAADPIDGYIGDLYPEYYQPCLDGLLSVIGRTLDYAEGRYEGHTASATFFTVSEPVYSWQRGSWLDPLEGEDDCGLIEWDPSGLFTDSDVAWLDPGEVTLMGAWGDTPMVRYEGGFVLNFDASLDEAGVAPAWGEPYGISATGSTGSTGEAGTWEGFSGFDLPEIVSLPPQLQITAPSPLGPGVSLARADTELTWTGSSDGLVAIALSATDDWTDGPFYELRCSVIDDGAFTVPGALLAALPADSTGSLTVKRRADAWVGTTSGRSFHGTAISVHDAWDLSIP